MKNLITSLIILFCPTLSSAQNNDVITSIRERYYRINSPSVNLDKLTFNATDYYFESTKLSIIKKDTQEGRYEYYLEFIEDKYVPYFIFFEPKNTTDFPLRAYYDSNSDLILLIHGENRNSLTPFDNHSYRFLKQDAFNAINLLFNHLEVAQNTDDLRSTEILSYVESINNKMITVDTIEYNSEEGGISGKLVYHDSQKRLCKSSSFSTAEHYSYSLNKYFSDGSLVYSTEEVESWVGLWSRLKVIINYFESNKEFRSEVFDVESCGRVFTYSNRNYYLDLAKDRLGDCVPTITYN